MSMDEDMDMLDSLFAAERGRTITASTALMQSVLADAAMVHAQPVIAPKPASLWSRIRAEFGGWQMVSGLVACAVVGLVMGYAQPFSTDVISVEETEIAFGLGSLFDDEFLTDLDT